MILYLWVNKFRNIERTGFNLSSNYEFDFNIDKEKSKKDTIVGHLSCKKLNNIKIFNPQIKDIKAIKDIFCSIALDYHKTTDQKTDTSKTELFMLLINSAKIE